MFYRKDYRRIMPASRVMLRGMRDLQNEMEFLHGGTRGPVRRQYPLINAWLSEDGMIVSAELPGIDPENIDVSIVGETLTLGGSWIAEDMPEGVEYFRRERGQGGFTRTLNLPFKVDTDSVEAIVVDGVLNLELPRLPEEKPRKISLKTG